jgi:hypothetical protein
MDTKVSSEDLLSMERIKWALKLTSSELEVAMLKNERQKLEHELFVARLYVKYGLSAEQAISPDGSIISSKQGNYKNE